MACSDTPPAAADVASPALNEWPDTASGSMPAASARPSCLEPPFGFSLDSGDHLHAYAIPIQFSAELNMRFRQPSQRTPGGDEGVEHIVWLCTRDPFLRVFVKHQERPDEERRAVQPDPEDSIYGGPSEHLQGP